MMEPGDHTVLLGGREGGPAAPAASTGDDIWGAVESPVASEEEDSSTVFMAPPPIAAPSAPAQAFTAQDYEVQYEADDLDATWRMPNEGESAPTYQGFEEFAETPLSAASSFVPPPPIPEPPAIAEAPPLEMPPPLTPAPPEPVFEPYDPFVAAAQHSAAGFEPVSPFDSDQTVDSAVTDDTFEPISTGAVGGFDAYGEPEIVAQNEAPLAEPEPVFETNAAHEPFNEPFDEIETPAPSEIPEPPALAAKVAPPAPDGSPISPGASTASSSIDDALIDKVVARVVDKLSEKIVQEIAWEVVPDLAEGMIQREIEALKAKLSKVPK
jgi:hypothetical protein